MDKRKAYAWGGVSLLILFVAFRPATAADITKSIGSGLIDVATGFGDFFTSLIGGSPDEATPQPVEQAYHEPEGVGLLCFKFPAKSHSNVSNRSEDSLHRTEPSLEGQTAPRQKKGSKKRPGHQEPAITIQPTLPPLNPMNKHSGSEGTWSCPTNQPPPSKGPGSKNTPPTTKRQRYTGEKGQDSAGPAPALT